MSKHDEQATGKAEPSSQARVIDSRVGFQATVQWSLQTALAREARTIYLADPDFTDWPLDAAGWIEPLTAWLKRPQRRLVMIASGFERIQQLHPRFNAWRPPFSHAIDARIPDPDLAVEWPTVLVDDGPVSMQLFDHTHWRGRAGVDARDAKACRELVDVLLQRSTPAWPVRPLGL